MKEFIPHDVIRDSALKLAHKMYKEDHFIPDVIYVSLRGGVYMANVFSEFYKMVCLREHRRPVLYAAVVARSYNVLRDQTRVQVDGWTYSPKYLRAGDKVLLVDDIFDTGNTVNALATVIMDKGIPRDDLKIAVYDYKVPPLRDMLTQATELLKEGGRLVVITYHSLEDRMVKNLMRSGNCEGREADC